MSHQDWNPVVFHKKTEPATRPPTRKAESANSNSSVGPYKEDEDGMPVKKTLPSDFGKKMAEARKEKGWTQKDLANKMNCKVSEIQQYEQNRHPNPNRSFARKIESKLGSNLF